MRAHSETASRVVHRSARGRHEPAAFRQPGRARRQARGGGRAPRVGYEIGRTEIEDCRPPLGGSRRDQLVDPRGIGNPEEEHQLGGSPRSPAFCARAARSRPETPAADR